MEKHTARTAQATFRYAVLTAAAALVVVLFRLIRVNETTVALAFLMLVLWTASRWRLMYSVYLSVLCTLFYNFFFLPPVGRFTIEDPRNWVALASFLCCSVLVSHLSNQEHRHAEALEQRRHDVERLYEFGQQLLLQEDLTALARTTPSVIASVFGIRAVALYLREQDVSWTSDPENRLPPDLDLRLTAAQSDSVLEAPAGVRIIPLLLGMRSLGALAVTETGYAPGIYESIGNLVAISLERAAALERTSRLEASRQSERLRSALLDSITHDLRTPLTAIRAAATTLVSQPGLPDAERAELTTVVEEESARLDRLIGQAVEMAQLDAATLQIRAQPQDVRELLETVLDEMRSQLRGRSVGIHVPEDLRPVPMDRELIARVLRHLIENALAYAPALSPIAIAAARDSDRLTITVADQGPGLEAAEQPFIFDKFFRGRQSRSSARGTGMGLAISKAIVEAHKGGITAANRPTGGAALTFWLPLAGEPIQK
ncbi:MAG TPA: ATP-binding protein [Acidobacteriaceae bacterium]|jgi:two-component system sensor histidine kinase KdpD|nr:ATP-binding protein [Acidobacteriaceae bacterium]